MKILIAEDEPIIRLGLRGMLEHAGYDVCAEARNGTFVIASSARRGSIHAD